MVQYMYRCTYLLSLIDIHAHARTLRIQMSFNFCKLIAVLSVTPFRICLTVAEKLMHDPIQLTSTAAVEFACRICMHDACARVTHVTCATDYIGRVTERNEFHWVHYDLDGPAHLDPTYTGTGIYYRSIY